jgi:hypothetical protein
MVLFGSNRQGLLKQLRDQQEALHTLSLTVKQLGESLSRLEGAHERLRGRFYALKGVSDAPPTPKSKQEVLRDFLAGSKGS